MDLVARGALRLGDFFLQFAPDASPGEQDLVLDLRPAAPRVPEWQASGALLGVQALTPLTTAPERQRRAMGFLGAGAGCAVPALAALRLGFGRVELVLHPDEEEPMRAMAAAAGAAGELLLHRRVDQAADGAFHNWAMVGTEGQAPGSLEPFAPFVRRLRPEGQMVLFGLPVAALEETFLRAAAHGMALRSLAIQGSLAALGGSLEHRNTFG
jgi:hypothetical protein